MTDRLWASLMFFTRLPFWRIRQVDAECFKHVVDYWPFVGWLTGGTAALVFWLVSGILPVTTAALAAIGTRLWLTGALHEDGLADFCDGFGGGTTRERTLAIMKDSHIGTYGVLGLVFCSQPCRFMWLRPLSSQPTCMPKHAAVSSSCNCPTPGRRNKPKRVSFTQSGISKQPQATYSVACSPLSHA